MRCDPSTTVDSKTHNTILRGDPCLYLYSEYSCVPVGGVTDKSTTVIR